MNEKHDETLSTIKQEAHVEIPLDVPWMFSEINLTKEELIARHKGKESITSARLDA